MLPSRHHGPTRANSNPPRMESAGATGAAALVSLRHGARFKLFFDEPGDVFQHAQLRGAQTSWLAIDDAKRADACAVSGMQRNPRIKADVRIADDHRIFGEAIVLQRIVYDQRFALED